MIKNWKGRTE